MALITDLTEKTTVVDNDLLVTADSQDTNKSKKVKHSTIWNYIIGKFSASLSEINSVCDGNTATASEISQICDGRVAGGTNSGDLLTVSGAQAMQYKNIKLSGFNDDPTVMACTSTQLNTLQYTTGTGRVNEIQQGFNIGNSTITLAGSYIYPGLVNVNFSSSDSMNFGPATSLNVSAVSVIKNISSTANATVNRLSSDRFSFGGVGYTSMVIPAGEAVALMAIGAIGFIVLGTTGNVTFS